MNKDQRAALISTGMSVLGWTQTNQSSQAELNRVIDALTPRALGSGGRQQECLAALETILDQYCRQGRYGDHSVDGNGFCLLCTRQVSAT